MLILSAQGKSAAVASLIIVNNVLIIVNFSPPTIIAPWILADFGKRGFAIYRRGGVYHSKKSFYKGFLRTPSQNAPPPSINSRGFHLQREIGKIRENEFCYL